MADNKEIIRQRIEAFKAKKAAERLQESTKAATKPAVRVLRKENTQTGVPARPLTINENINQRINEAKLTPGKETMFRVLSENIVKHARTINEATQMNGNTFGAIGNGAGSGLLKTYFDIFFGSYLNLIAPEIAAVIPMKTRVAEGFYWKAVAGVTKGNVTAGQDLITPFAVADQDEFTSEKVGMGKIAVGATGAQTKTGPAWGPMVAKSFAIEGADLTWASDTTFTGVLKEKAGNINITAGTVTVAGGTVTVTFTLANAITEDHAVAYRYDNHYAPSQVAELNGDLVPIQLEAKTRTIKTNFSIEAALDFEAQFGKKLEVQLAEDATAQIQRETDLEVIREVFKAAPETVLWNKQAGIAVGNYETHKLSFKDAVYKAVNRVFAKNKRFPANILIVGIDALTIVQTLPGYKGIGIGEELGGPRVVGTLDGLKVIASPDIAANEWLVLFKSTKQNLNAGIVFGPYIPVMSTQPTTLDDLMTRRAFLTSYALKVVNPDYFVRGMIVDNPAFLPIQVYDADGNIVSDFAA